jgi:hypothetical protein
VAAAVGKQLLEANLELRQRHNSLLSKYPATPSSVTPSSIPFPGTEPSWIPELDASSPVIASKTPTLSRAPSHSRRISVTPQALAALSEHNTELLAQLTQIQDETSRANLDGKRKLRQLEKEIAGLRAELDFAQERNGELEEQIENAEHVKQMEDKRREREAKLKALRERASTATGEGVKDYAPAHPFSGSPIAAVKTPKRRIPTTQTEGNSSDKEETPLIARPTVLDFDDGLSSPDPRQASLGPVSAGEFAVISQLLAKIEELETANREMVAASRERDERLRKVTEEANAIRQAYENLEDEADDEDEAAASMRSMVFKRAAALRNSSSSGSLGRRLRRERGQSAPSLRGKGKEKERLSILGTPKSGKTRRALSRSLFEPPSTRDEGEQADSESADDVNKSRRRPHSRSGSGDKTPQLRFVAPSVDDLSSEFSIAEDGYQRRFTKMPPSPMMNKLRLASPRDALDLDLTCNKPGLSPPSRMEGFAFQTSSSPPDSSSVPRSLQSTLSRRSLLFQGHTLGSELGSEFGEGWGASAIKDELLFDDDNLVDGDEEQTNPDSNFSGSSSQAPFAIEYSENPAVAAIRAALDPRNQGKLLQQDEHILPLGSLAGTPGETFFLLEHAVQARPTVWKEPNAERVKLALLERTRGHRALPSSADVEAEATEEKNEDPWEDKYEESGFEQSELEDAKGRKERTYSNSERPTMEERNRSWKRREAARERLERTAARRLSLVPGAGGTFDPNPNKERQRALATIEEKDGDKTLVKKREETKDDATVVRGGGLTANLSKTIVELWILLQAIVIIVVFVYSMARKGPRAILDAAEVRRPR